ncbi:hypothetical protein DXA14_12335 [Hungatella hathewayi]|nr:hypothetical protein DXA14_12335 [Hungatella hathewayi]
MGTDGFRTGGSDSSVPDMIEVPGAPEKIVGMIYHAGGLIPVFRPEKGMKTVPKKAPACVVLIRKEDGSLYGMAADEVTGGDAIDTVYE